ncbi:ATP-binding cassette sub- D member 4 [Dinochytrium kinnereticum]|nr:ATP-binding cassette sub- D member 4 [Dinochytrium kinnereticum]
MDDVDEISSLLAQDPPPGYQATPSSLHRRQSQPSLSAPKKQNRSSPCPTPSTNTGNPSLDAVFFRRFLRILRILFAPPKSPEDSASLLPIYLSLIVACLLFELIVWRIGIATASFYSTLIERDLKGFLKTVLECFLLYVAVSMMKGLVQFVHGIMGIRLRRRLTLLMHAAYTASAEALYEIAVLRVPPPPNPMTGSVEPLVGTSASPSTSTTRTRKLLSFISQLFRKPSPDVSSATPSTLASGHASPISTSSSYHTFEAISPTATSSVETSLPSPTAPRPPPLLADNPDQTITQDVDKLGEQLRRILESLVIDPFLIIYYTYQTYALARSPLGPLIIYLYFILSALTCRLAMNPLIPLIYRKERAEGDFRFVHVHLRTHAESVALMGGHEAERGRLNAFLERVLGLQRRVLDRSVVLKCVTELVNYLGACLAYLVIAVPVFDGTLDGVPPGELGAIVAKNLFLTLYLIYRFTMITDLSDRFSDIAGFTARIGHLLEVMETASSTPKTASPVFPPGPTSPLSLEPTTDPLLTVTNLSFTRPAMSSNHLIRNLSFTVHPRLHVVIEGPSGAGKSALLKILAGLWGCKTGGEVVFGVPREDVIFLSQVPYIGPDGRCPSDLPLIISPTDVESTGETTSTHEDVLDQLSYPSTRISLSVATFALNVVGLTHLLDGGTPLSTLSQGERQRLAFARVLVRNPKLVFMDEATSNVDVEMEGRMWRELLRKERGVTVVAVGHREVQGLEGAVRVKVPRL